MKLNLHPKGIPKLEPLGTGTPLKKGGVVVGMRKEGDKEKIYFVGDEVTSFQVEIQDFYCKHHLSQLSSPPNRRIM